MALTVALRRQLPTLTEQVDVVVHDLTSRGPEPWVRLSPFFPHGGIPRAVHTGPHRDVRRGHLAGAEGLRVGQHRRVQV